MSSALCSVATAAPTPCVEFTSLDNEWTSLDPLKLDTFSYTTGGGNPKLFFGTVRWKGSGSYSQLPAHTGQDLLWIHVPQHTFKTGAGITPDYSRPIPIQVDKEGRFGFVTPSGVTHVYVKMYGTLWRKVTFDGGSTDTVQEKSWDGNAVNWNSSLELRYGDVNEDNKIIRTINDAARDRDYLDLRVGGAVDVRLVAGDAIFKYDYVCDLNRDNKVDGPLVGDGLLFDSLEPTQAETEAADTPGRLDGAPSL